MNFTPFLHSSAAQGQSCAVLRCSCSLAPKKILNFHAAPLAVPCKAFVHQLHSRTEHGKSSLRSSVHSAASRLAPMTAAGAGLAQQVPKSISSMTCERRFPDLRSPSLSCEGRCPDLRSPSMPCEGRFPVLRSLAMPCEVRFPDLAAGLRCRIIEAQFWPLPAVPARSLCLFLRPCGWVRPRLGSFKSTRWSHVPELTSRRQDHNGQFQLRLLLSRSQASRRPASLAHLKRRSSHVLKLCSSRARRSPGLWPGQTR